VFELILKNKKQRNFPEKKKVRIREVLKRMVAIFRRLLIIETNSFSLIIKCSEANCVTNFWSFDHSCEGDYGMHRGMSVVYTVYTWAPQSVAMRFQNMENLSAWLSVHTSNMHRLYEHVAPHNIAVVASKVPNRKYYQTSFLGI
jgi:hypothetical protein